MKRRIALLVLLLSFGLISKSCQSNQASKNKIPTTHVVKIIAMKFIPDTLHANIGDTVVFKNEGIVQHNVTNDDSSWASPNFDPDSSWQMTVKGNLNYHCSIHPVMKGVIIAQ